MWAALDFMCAWQGALAQPWLPQVPNYPQFSQRAWAWDYNEYMVILFWGG